MPTATSELPITKHLPLVTDLDGTLCRTDTLWECFYAAWRQRWWLPLAMLGWLLAGRNMLKLRLAEFALPNIATLPWRPEVLAALDEARANGRRCVLATAASQHMAQTCAQHLQRFDEVLASDAVTNLKGTQKAALLVQHFSERGFDYIGDSRADLPVWAVAAGRFTVSAITPEGGQRLAASNDAVLANWLHMLRARHWVKNLLVYVALLTAHAWNSTTTWAVSTQLFVTFCMVCSAIYVFNDLFDLASDRQHPSKRLRPLAAGLVSLSAASGVALLLLFGGLLLATTTIGLNATAILLCYLTLNALYTLRLKRIAVLDVFILAILYTLRIVAGAVAIVVPLSSWLVAFSFFSFLSLAFLKRAADLVQLAPEIQLAGRGWYGRDIVFVNTFGISSALAASLVLMLYIASEQVAILYRQPSWLWGVAVVVLFWLSRAWKLTCSGHMSDDPVLFATRDRLSWLCVIMIGGFMGLALL